MSMTQFPQNIAAGEHCVKWPFIFHILKHTNDNTRGCDWCPHIWQKEIPNSLQFGRLNFVEKWFEARDTVLTFSLATGVFKLFIWQACAHACCPCIEKSKVIHRGVSFRIRHFSIPTCVHCWSWVTNGFHLDVNWNILQGWYIFTYALEY